MTSFKPSEGADQVQASEEISRRIFVAGRDAPELLYVIEEALDQVALCVEREIAFAFGGAVCLWRDYRLDRAHFQAFDEAVGVIALVCKQGLGLDRSGQNFGLGYVVNLPASDAERQRIAQRIGDHMDFGGQTAARPAYGLVEAPFLRAPALC